ncbi:MAG: S53 family serine peptidase, partial [Xanthomonadales bacterium]|nr:S53 family serine peptidase [Xanthomonadales bacterium]
MNQQPRAPRRQRVLVSFASALLAGAAAFGSANASTPINPGVATVSVASAAHLGAKDVILGTLSATQQLHIVVSLKLRNQVQLDNFIATATNLNKAVAKRHMSRAQFAAEHSPTVAQADSVKQFLLNNGFSKVTIAPNRLLVSAYASAAVVESAFKTPLVQVHTAHGENAYANTASVQVPMALQDTVQTVLGLQNVRHPRTFLRHAKTHGNASTYAVTGHNPTEFPHIYGADGLPTASTVTVGIITAGDMTQTLTDLATFASQNSLDPVNTQVVTVGNGSSDTSGTGEWNMDSQAIIGMSGGVQKLVIYAADSMSFADLTSAMNTAVNDSANNPVAINMSFGACESNSSAAAAEGQVFQAGIALGMTFAASSGDDGADCDSNSNFGVADPASSPFVVAVGGTRVNTSNGDYSSESAWSSGGGGFSTFQPKPAWQTMVSGNFRSVPDVAFDGDPSSGAEVIINGSTQIIGGTSLSAPIFVGAWARLRAANPALTFAAPYLYSTLTAGDYNDITTGSNATTQSGGQYASGPGFDQTSGFGSFKMAQVAADIGAPGAPSVSLSFSPSSIGINDTSTLTISLSNVSQPSTAAVLNADFTDTLPTGLSVAATPNISTTCSGSVTAAANSITLPNGSSIAAQTACTINVDVTAVGNGTYANTVATGALQTTLGNNAYAASATLTVGNGL